MYGEQVSPSEVTPVLTSDVQELSEDQRMVRRDFIVTMLRNLGIATPETLAQIQADPLSNHGHVETYFTYMEGEADLKKIAVECGVPVTEVVVKRNERCRN